MAIPIFGKHAGAPAWRAARRGALTAVAAVFCAASAAAGPAGAGPAASAPTGAGRAIGALTPGFCAADAPAPEPGEAPEGYALAHVFVACGGSADRLEAYGHVYTPRLVSPWERPRRPGADAGVTGERAAPDAFARLDADAGADAGAIRVLNRPNDLGVEPGAALGTDIGPGAGAESDAAPVRRPASFRVDQSAEATLAALAQALGPGERVEIGSWSEGPDLRLRAELRRPADAAAAASAADAEPPRLRVVSDLRWRDGRGVTRALVLPYRNADTLRYARAQLRASAAADRIAKMQLSR